MRGLGILVVVVGIIGGIGAGTPVPRQVGGVERDPGEVAMSRSCLTCHDLTPIRMQALDADGWTVIVDTMIDEHGAEVPDEEIPALIDYLSRVYDPLPAGPGREILLERCTICHTRDRIWAHAGEDREHWETTLLSMLNEGAFLNDQEFETLLSYLAPSR